MNITPKNDGNIITVGATRSFDNVETDSFIVKTPSNFKQTGLIEEKQFLGGESIVHNLSFLGNKLKEPQPSDMYFFANVRNCSS